MSAMTRNGPEPIGRSQPTPTTGICARCKQPLPDDRKHARACQACVDDMRRPTPVNAKVALKQGRAATFVFGRKATPSPHHAVSKTGARDQKSIAPAASSRPAVPHEEP